MVKVLLPASEPAVQWTMQEAHWLSYQYRMRSQKLPAEYANKLAQAEGDIDVITIAGKIVNDQLTYGEDIDTYGHREYIASFNQAHENGVGDCDEYSSMWYFMLTKMGMDVAILSVNLYGRPDLYHSVAVIKASDGDIYVLDMNMVQHGRYKPVKFSIWVRVWDADVHYASAGLWTQSYASWAQ